MKNRLNASASADIKLPTIKYDSNVFINSRATENIIKVKITKFKYFLII